MPEPIADQFALELSKDPAHVAELLRVHIPDDRGKCSGCHLDDKQREPWPCGVHWYAAKAHQILQRRAG